MVVMCAWLFDIALSAILNVARFDLGFYARPHLRPLRREFRARRAADRQCRPAGQVGPPARNAAPRRPLPNAISTPSASACSARSWNPPTTPSSPNRSTAPSPAGTAPPNACSASRRPKPSASTSTSSSRRTGAPRCATSSNGSAVASRSNITKPRACARTAASVDVSLSISPIRSACRRDRRRFQDRARHHRKQADAAGAQPGDRGAAAHLRDFATTSSW